jgi:hypothetical protein
MVLESTLTRAGRTATLVMAAGFFVPALLCGQTVVREAVWSFPDDTHQLAYSDLAELRASSNFLKIRQQFLTPQLHSFQGFLTSMGMDPEKDVEGVVFGWRGSPADTGSFFGLAEGRFQPERTRQYFAQAQLPTRQYAGQDLYAFGTGEDPVDLFFTFLSPSLAAFGRLSDLLAVLDGRAGQRLTLGSNPSMVNWEAELEGTAPQWGVLTGKGAATTAARWLTGGAELPVDPSVVLAPVMAVLYRMEWSSGFSTHLSIICQNAESATALDELLALWRDSQQAAGRSSDAGSALAGLVVQANGSRVELSLTGPIEALEIKSPPPAAPATQ